MFVRVVVSAVNKQYSITLPVRRISSIRLAIRTDLGQFLGAIPVRVFPVVSLTYAMEDIFQWCREGIAMQVRVWLDDTEHDMNQGWVKCRIHVAAVKWAECFRRQTFSPLDFFYVSRDDHGFSPLHWAAKEGHLKIVEMLVQRGARINSTNRGDDTPLHLAAAHGHHEIVHLVRVTFF